MSRQLRIVLNIIGRFGVGHCMARLRRGHGVHYYVNSVSGAADRIASRCGGPARRNRAFRRRDQGHAGARAAEYIWDGLYVLHLLGDGTQGDAEYLLDFVYLDATSGAVYELNQVDGGIVASLQHVDAALRYLPEEGATALFRGHLTLLRAELDARIALWQRRQAEQPTERPAARLLWPLQAGTVPPMTTALTA